MKLKKVLSSRKSIIIFFLLMAQMSYRSFYEYHNWYDFSFLILSFIVLIAGLFDFLKSRFRK